MNPLNHTPLQKMMSYYESDNPGTKTNLMRLLTHGKLGGYGRLLIYPVDQGFEHGPGRSFSMNPHAYDPTYHIQLALDAGVSAYAAPLGLLEAVAGTYAGTLPTILKMNSGNALTHPSGGPDQAVTASVQDALRLGCSAIGFTIYPGSPQSHHMYEEIRELSREAKNHGLAVVIWSYPRGGGMSSMGETALDIVAYGAHMACLLGAHIVKCKLPSAHLENEEAKKIYIQENIPRETLQDRVRHVVQCCFNGRRLVIFSGGESKDLSGVYEEAQAIHNGGGHGSIIGRNCFKRPRQEALALLESLITLYTSPQGASANPVSPKPL